MHCSFRAYFSVRLDKVLGFSKVFSRFSKVSVLVFSKVLQSLIDVLVNSVL